MSELIAALPMYDWPETRERTDAEWARLRDLLRARGVDAPERLARRNADLPAVPRAVRDPEGRPIAPDPAILPPQDLDLHVLWRHPKLLLAQTCWGPMEHGLADHVQVIGQPDYSAYEGGRGEFYSSAIVMRAPAPPSASPTNGAAFIPLHLLMGARLAFNSADSMSGLVALGRDLEAADSGFGIFAERMQTGSHRASARAVAEGRADVAAIDCRSWDMITRHQPDTAEKLVVIGWTGLRKGLPLIAAAGISAGVVAALREALAEAGVLTL